MNEPLTTTDGLKPGDVILAATKIRNKGTGEEWWWKRFCCVIQAGGADVYCVTLKVRPDPEKDHRVLSIGRDIITQLPEDQWPQGVVAMRMKLIMRGAIKLGE